MMSKQLINLVGALVVLAALLGGVLLIALPFFSNAEATSADASRVDGDNAVFEAQLTVLRADDARFDDIAEEVAALRTQIPSAVDADDVFEILAAASVETGATVVSVSVSGAEDWTPRMAGDDATDAAAADAATIEPGAMPAPVPEETLAEGTGDAAQPTSPRTQVAFTILATTADPAQAVAFIDALGRGPRLVSIVHSSLTPTNGTYDVTVDALTFVRDDS